LSLIALAVTCLAVWSVAFWPVSAKENKAKPAGSFKIDSWTFDRGNGWVISNPDMYADYRDKFPQLVTVDDGQSPWCVEYDVDFPVDTTYTLHVSCIGCHEFRNKAPNLKLANPMALDRPVEKLYPQPGDTGPRMVHYARDVQPILDKHCVTCHGREKPKGELTLTGELTRHFSRSYENLTGKALVSYLHTSGFGSSHLPAEPPLTFGSHQSEMVKRIQKAPCKSNVTREEFIRIVTWIDANAPFYGTHRGKKNLKWKDDPEFRPMPLAGK